MLPPPHLDGLERLVFYRAARASEEERAVVEDLVRRQEAGESLAPNKEADREREKREREKRAG